jgi:hypothetical protein
LYVGDEVSITLLEFVAVVNVFGIVMSLDAHGLGGMKTHSIIPAKTRRLCDR